MSGSARGTKPVARWWEGRYYPSAGEVIGWECCEWEAEPLAASLGESVGDRMAAIFAAPGAGSARDPESPPETSTREALHRGRASRRARGRLRRYAAANGLDRLIVLTYADQTADLPKVKRDTARFVKRWLLPRIATGEHRRGPYVIGWERHKSGNWHVNVLVRPYLKQGAIERGWGRGFVWISRFRSDGKGGGRGAARKAAAYVAKYVAKDFETAPLDRTHRYEVGQGFQPAEVRVYGLTSRSLEWAAIEEAGGHVSYRWQSMRVGADRSPPVLWAMIEGQRREKSSERRT